MAIKSKFFEIDKEDDFFDDDSNEFKICKKCKSRNIATAKFCLECGSNEFVKTSRNKEESFKFCADCKTKVESTAKFCHNCGSKNFVDSLDKILSNVQILEAKYTKEYENLNSKIIDAKSKIKDLNKDIKVLKEKNALLVSEWEEKLKAANIEYIKGNDKANSFTSNESGYVKKINKIKEQIAKLEEKYESLSGEKVEKTVLTVKNDDIKPKTTISVKGKSAIQLYNAGETAYNLKRDYETAFTYFEASANMGYAKSQHMLGIMYWRGWGISVDLNKAFYWVNEGVKQNNYYSQVILAKFYLEGIGTRIDQTKAYELYLKASTNSKSTNRVEAYEGLGLCYKNGYGVNMDAKKAIEYYSKLTVDYKRLIKIAKVHYRVSKDYKNALKFATDAFNAAKQFDPNGEICCFLGKLYYHGHGVEKDYNKAFEYFKLGFKRASDSELDPELNYYIGLSFINGYGTEKNLEKGKKYLIEAEKQNFSSATYALYDVNKLLRNRK